MATAGVSTLGVKLYYCAESTAGTRPTSNYTQLTRINAIGGIQQEPEQIDASALEDLVTRNIAGRTGTGDTVTVTVNVTTETNNYKALKLYRRIGFKEDFCYPQAYLLQKSLF